MSGKKLGAYSKPTVQRPKCETPLRQWLDGNGISVLAFARRLNKATSHVRYWVDGQQVPSLVDAFRIERETQGGVPVASWMGTEIVKFMWNNAVSEREDAT